MEFFDRENDLKELNALKKGMVVIYGRRRVGKTELIKQFIKNRDAIYFFVNPRKTDLLEEYMDRIKEKTSTPGYIRIKKWDELIQFLFDLPGEKVIIFDEFQRFLEIDESIIYEFQKSWDLCEKKPLLILSGSSIGMIKKIFMENKAPLFKRATEMIELKPFTFFEVTEILSTRGITDVEELMKIYLVFGGTIYYYVLMENFDCKNFDEIVGRLILNPYSPLRNEVRDILIEEFGKDYRTYLAILTAIALGKTKRNEIADYAKIKTTSLSPYFYDLIDLLSLIRRKISVTEDQKSKDARYEISDNFVNFWMRYVYRNESYFEIGDYGTIRKKIESDLQNFFGHRFEEFAEEFLLELRRKGEINFQKAGRWWGHYRNEKNERKELEIDLVALNKEKKEMYLFECKWKELGEGEARSILKELHEKSKFVNWFSGAKGRKRKEQYGIFAKKVEKKENLRRDGFLIFDLEDLR